jgi:DNA polymerase V
MGKSNMGIKENVKKIGIIDCNNFYVSCERLFNPESIGRPTVVLSNNDGCVIARSQEAKDLGIKMGEPFFKSREFMDQHRFCVYSSNYNLYGDMSDRVMKVISEFGNDIEVYSIDEAFVDFSNIPLDDLTETLLAIKEEVIKKVGIPVSIGVGPNKTLAKLTSFLAKQQLNYNGVCSYWDLPNFRNMCYGIDVDEVWGIGRKWAKKLKNIGVESVGQFINTNEYTVRKLMNINGLKTQLELTEMYCFPIQRKSKPKKNIASTRSFGKDVQDFNQLGEAMYTYIKNGVKKLSQNRLLANKVTIFVSGNYHKGDKYHHSKTIKLQTPTRDSDLIWSQIHQQYKVLCDKSEKYKKCGIVFNELTPDTVIQTSLFTDEVKVIEKPQNDTHEWEMRQDYITQKYTTSWDELPYVFV